MSLSVFSQKLYFENYNVNNNLPSSQVNTVFQDSYGFIWVGTGEGVRKFDGANFKEVYLLGNKEISGSVNSIVESKRFIYIASGKSVYRSLGNYFQEIKFYRNDQSNFINKTLLVDTTLMILSDNGLWQLRDTAIVKYNTHSVIDFINIKTVHYSRKKNQLWIGTESNGLIVYSLASQKIVTTNEMGLTDVYQEKILDITEDSLGAIYFSVAQQGIYKVQNRQVQLLGAPADIDLTQATGIAIDRQDKLWITTLNAGLVELSNKEFRKIDYRTGLSCTGFLSVMIDRENNVWLGSLKAGLFQLKKSHFVIYNSLHGLSSDNIISIRQSTRGQTYLLTGNGISTFRAPRVRNLEQVTDKDNFPSVIVALPDGNMAAGTTSGNLIIFDDDRKISQGHVCKEPITAACFLSNDEAVVANSEGEIYSYDFVTSEPVLLTKQLAGDHIYALACDGKKNLWIGTSRGIYVLKKNQLQKQFEDNENLSLSEIYSLEIRKNVVFIVPECCGVWMYDIDKNQLYSFDKTRGLSGNSARAMYVESMSEAFITTNNMLNHVIFLDSTDIVKQYKGYSNQEYTEFSIGALEKDADGNILAGTNNGLMVYNEKNDSLSKMPPKVVIEEMMLMNRPTNWARNYPTNFKTGLPKNLELTYDQNDLTFEFIGIKFSSNEKLYYSYKLVGFQDEWIYTNETNKAIFSNLPDGSYDFLVRVSNNNVVWSQPLSYRFRVLPPFWKTKWFVIMMLIVTGLVITIIFRNQVTFNKNLVKSEATDVPIKSARMIMWFAAVIIPASGLLYAVITGDKGIIVLIHLAMGVVIFALVSLTYASRFVKSNIGGILLYSYVSVLLSYQIIALLSNIHPYMVASIVIAITTGCAIISKLKTYVFIALLLIISSLLVMYMVNKPLYNPLLFLFGIFSATSVSVLILLVKLNLSEKLIFADSVINRGNSLVVAGNSKGEIIYVSENIKDILGYEKEEVFGDKWWKVTADDLQDIKEYTYASRDENTPYHRAVKEKNGGRRWIQWVDKKFSDDLLVGIGTDITLQKEYQDRFEYIVENANDIIYTTGPEGNFTYTNEVAQRITGYTTEELLSKNFQDIIHESAKDEVLAFYKNQKQEHCSQFYYEFPIISKQGSMIWIGQSIRFLYDYNNEFLGSEAICRDITELIEAKNVLNDHNERLQMLNLSKERILSANTIEEVCINILKTLSLFIHVTDAMSIHINIERTRTSYAFMVNKGQEVTQVHYSYIDFAFLDTYFPELSTDKELVLDHDKLGVWRELFHYIDDEQKTALLVPIFIGPKLLGLVSFFASQENVYNSEDTWALNDIAISISNFIVSYEQKEIIRERNIEIENYNRRLEILNYSKKRLMQAAELPEVYKELILVLKEKLNDIYRVSVSVFDIDKNVSQVYYLNTLLQKDTVQSKFAVLHNNTSVPTLLRGEVYYNPHFEITDDFSDDDKHWYRVGVRSTLRVPIKINGQIYGAVNLMSSLPDNFTASNQELTKEIVESSSLIIEQIIFKNIIAEKNKDITDNIQYAKYIQDAIMPGEAILKSSLADSFLFFSQKDILGGDFYWFDTIGELTYIAVGDCTGHGVSGSLLSILASNFIKQAVLEMQMIDPASVLEFLNAHLQATLNQYNIGKQIIDGLDITLVVVNKEQNTLYFSSAMHTAYMIRENELTEIKGNRKPIGSGYDNKGTHFTTHVLSLARGDCFYMTTDGYMDQFQMITGKKFGRNRFKQMLLTICDLPMDEQKLQVVDTHMKWRGVESQTDDICVIGFKYQ